MSKRAEKIVFQAQVSHRHEANALLCEPGSTVLVHRGLARSIAMACPDGCGDQLTINLDERAGPAWRHYVDGQSVSLFPSVWRDTGCGSHFIVWRSKIYWCDLHDELDTPNEDDVQRTLEQLTNQFASYVTIADQLGLVPWTILSACTRLCQRGVAEASTGTQQGQFRRKD